MTFNNEAEFENALIHALTQNGWENEILTYPTERDLIENWKTILFENNNIPDRLNGAPLTDSEMQQIQDQITALRTPVKLNGFINGKTIAIKRDNPADAQHLGKEISLKIYDRQEIAAGQSRYQIARQPRYNRADEILQNRRGDLTLLINGMPVIHIELKKSGVSVQQAYNQIEKYSRERIFGGIFSLIQVFAAMTPEETLYFANPGTDGKFAKDFAFHWADFNNEPINDWKKIASTLLSIPMTHQLIGFYTVADKTDGILKVMRSYQYYAANAISDRVLKHTWNTKDPHGGFIWHTTGSGKTMTSFKSAQLIANSKDADKVIFLVDRIELGTQSLNEYQNIADDRETVQQTETTHTLISKLKSSSSGDTLIVTSIQKMSNIVEEEGVNTADIELINAKRLVFIVDEAHRSTFGKMLHDIRQTFPYALFFGFTGTPIQDENQKKNSTTSSIFGNELHRYSIADGIRDKNVLGFDPYKILTYKDTDLREAVALENAKADTRTEALSDPQKKKIYYEYMQKEMADTEDENGKITLGIESLIPATQYDRIEHQNAVIQDIRENWEILSHGGEFHALFATTSIADAIKYYRLIKEQAPNLKITALFDPNIDNKGGAIFKEDGLKEIIEDYNETYGKHFAIPTHAQFKKDIANRLAHKGQYIRLEADDRIDILIVVDQMLTGFDSKWINTLYLDKILRYEEIIQAFSRTNRIFDAFYKPFGIIRYYRKPHTMETNIEKAVKLYSGDKPLTLFVSKLKDNLLKMNATSSDIIDLFTHAGIPDFEKLPEDKAFRGKFAKLFNELNTHLTAAQIQGFTWDQTEYTFTEDTACKNAPAEVGTVTIRVEIDKRTYNTLLQRYKELREKDEKGGEGDDGDIPYEIDSHLTEIDTGKIDADYMNANFEKYLKALGQKSITKEELQVIESDLHKSFAYLSQEEQKYANAVIHAVENGEIQIESGKTFRDLITDVMFAAKNAEIAKLSRALGVDMSKLKEMLNTHITEANINAFGRFDNLLASVDKTKAREFFERSGEKLSSLKLNMRIQKLLREFILRGGFDIELSERESTLESSIAEYLNPGYGPAPLGMDGAAMRFENGAMGVSEKEEEYKRRHKNKT